MKQVPTNATMHSLSSLSKADLSIYDSVDDQVLSDYAVSTSFWIFYKCGLSFQIIRKFL